MRRRGVIAAQVFAAKKLRDEGLTDIGMLYLVGEEDGSDGAKAANSIPNRNRFLINEPTESRQRWRPKARCESPSKPEAGRRIRPIRNWANRRSKNLSTPRRRSKPRLIADSSWGRRL